MYVQVHRQERISLYAAQKGFPRFPKLYNRLDYCNLHYDRGINRLFGVYPKVRRSGGTLQKLLIHFYIDAIYDMVSSIISQKQVAKHPNASSARHVLCV